MPIPLIPLIIIGSGLLFAATGCNNVDPNEATTDKSTKNNYIDSWQARYTTSNIQLANPTNMEVSREGYDSTDDTVYFGIKVNSPSETKNLEIKACLEDFLYSSGNIRAGLNWGHETLDNCRYFSRTYNSSGNYRVGWSNPAGDVSKKVGFIIRHLNGTNKSSASVQKYSNLISIDTSATPAIATDASPDTIVSPDFTETANNRVGSISVVLSLAMSKRVKNLVIVAYFKDDLEGKTINHEFKDGSTFKVAQTQLNSDNIIRGDHEFTLTVDNFKYTTTDTSQNVYGRTVKIVVFAEDDFGKSYDPQILNYDIALDENGHDSGEISTSAASAEIAQAGYQDSWLKKDQTKPLDYDDGIKMVEKGKADYHPSDKMFNIAQYKDPYQEDKKKSIG